MHIGKFACKLTAFHETGAAPEICKPYFAVVSDFNLSWRGAILREILLETDFSRTDLIYDLLLQEDEAGRERSNTDGHVISILRSASHLSACGVVLERAGGFSYYVEVGALPGL